MMPLNPEYLPATRGKQQELVLLHGWGSSREIWRPLLAYLRPWASVTLLDIPGCTPSLAADGAYAREKLLDAILAVAPRRAVYLGWSLGGQLAVELASRCPQRIAGVVTLCSNPQFTGGLGWPGMDTEEFTGFRAAYAADAVSALRRFDSLQVRGATQARPLLRQLQASRRGAAGPKIMHGLDWLAKLNQRKSLPRLRMPQLHLLAEHDGLVPAALASALTDLLRETPAAQVQVLAGASHLAPLDSAAGIARQTHDFLADTGLLHAGVSQDAGLDKKDVAASFSRAAATYDSVARLQRDVGKRLLTGLDDPPGAAFVVLDLGCGTGSFRPELRRHYPDASYIGLDLALGMLQYARGHAADDSLWLAADAEALPLATHSVDLVFSSLAIQWCYRPEQLFAELSRVLRPGGRCVFSTLGPDTLHELRGAWAAVDKHQHVNRFLSADDLLGAAGNIPGMELGLQTERRCMHYQRVGELLAELKALGAHNINPGRPAGLTSRKTLQGMLLAYESWRVDGVLPASYEVIFGELKKL